MANWHEVSSLAELDLFLIDVGGFHDGIVKELHWVNRDFIEESLSMAPFHLSDARLLVQRQNRNQSAVEIYLERCWRLGLDTVNFVSGSVARTVLSDPHLGNPHTLLLLDIERSSFAFERMPWRNASHWMGPELRFGSFDLPVDESAVPSP